MLNGKRIAFVGSGLMAEAMIKGLVRGKVLPPRDIVASGPRVERGTALAEQYGVEIETDNRRAIVDRDIVIFSVKPQVMKVVVAELRQSIRPDSLVLSIVAGVPIRTFVEGLGHPVVVRAMPNTPGQIGEGITVWTATPQVKAVQLTQTEIILGALGELVKVDNESFLDMATALSGTGPAYVLLFMEALIDAGVHLGFPRHVARQLVMQTMRGTVEYARQSSRHPATLRNEVTSPGGTSAAALYHMEKGGIRTVVSRAVWAAFERSISLGEPDQTERLPSKTKDKGQEQFD